MHIKLANAIIERVCLIPKEEDLLWFAHVDWMKGKGQTMRLEKVVTINVRDFSGQATSWA